MDGLTKPTYTAEPTYLNGQPKPPEQREPQNYDSPSAHQYDSWTDQDLYRAVELDPTCAPEYVAELNARRAARAAQAELEARVNSQYGLVPTDQEYGLPPRMVYGIDTSFAQTYRPLTFTDKLAYYVSRIRLTLGI